jgi:hypothetical protein
MNVTNTAARLDKKLLSRSLSLVSLRLERLRLGRLFAGLSLAMALSLPLDLGLGGLSASPAMASVGSDVRLSQLEVKFFKHTYPKDEEAVRLERLEKMIFGEARSGASEQRLKNLADTVPNLGAVAAEDSDKGEAAASKPATRPVNNGDSDLDLSEERSQSNKPGGQVLSGESKYPAVTALEQSIFKRDYASDPVADRLNRLESKVFGKPSKFTDLSERVDALKEKTRVDVAKQAPPGTDWLDEEDDDINFPAPKQASRQPVARSDGEDGRSFSGRDLRKDMQNAFGSRATGASASGGYGMGSGSVGSSSGSNSASGGYGMGSIGSPRSAGRALDDEDDDLPPVAPRRAASAGSSARSQPGASAANASRAAASDRFSDSGDAPAAVPGGAIGLSSKVAALENAVLGKTFASDPLIERVGRLEETVFPNKADSAASLSLPERVAKLVEKVPIAAAPAKTARANRSRRDDFDDDLDMGTGMSSLGSMSNMGGGMTSQSQVRGSGGLGKIINSIGNMLGGGYGSYGAYGGYPAGYSTSYGVPGSAAMARDPSTGYLIDSMSGNLINPTTGQVVGRSAGYPAGAYGNSAYGGYGTGLGGLPVGAGFGYPAGMGMGLGVPVGVPMGGYSSFNNGFSPYGYPAGGGYGCGR